MTALILLVVGFVIRDVFSLLYALFDRRRHRLRGNYFDAREPFRIAGRGRAWAPERTEEAIDRAAERLSRFPRHVENG